MRFLLLVVSKFPKICGILFWEDLQHSSSTGPRTLEQIDLDHEIAKLEVINKFIEEVLEFVKREENEKFTETVEKL